MMQVAFAELPLIYECQPTNDYDAIVAIYRHSAG
jgi:hypothetical protein